MHRRSLIAWTTPVVASVLPAHATTTAAGGGDEQPPVAVMDDCYVKDVGFVPCDEVEQFASGG
jgi:hypothetical protein